MSVQSVDPEHGPTGHDSEDHEEAVLSRAEQKAEPLFRGRVMVYPQAVAGRWRQLKWTALVGMLAVYYVLPWLRWTRAGDAPDQAVLVDLATRRIYFFWIEIWAQEFYFVTAGLILASLVLFLVTAIGGRLWCGFACPQTVWTDLFMYVERLIEGDRNARIRLDKHPYSEEWWKKKSAKHAAWLGIALATGGAWIMYFYDAPTLVADFFTFNLSFTVFFFILLFTAATYLLAGFAREQVCTFMCPWPRFQAALLDADSLVVTYQKWRGEPRGKHKKGDTWEGRGDCIDCKQCVAVCPTGIDIRDGLQLECIGCGLCADACDAVMDRVERPRGLISFDTDYNRLAREAGKPTRIQVVRPRTLAYMALLVVIGGLTLAGLMSRSAVDVSIIHTRNPLFVTLSDGSVRNAYTVRLINKEREAATYTLAIDGIEAASVWSIDDQPSGATELPVTVEPDSVESLRLFVGVPRGAVFHAADITFTLTDADGAVVATHETVFRAPDR